MRPSLLWSGLLPLVVAIVGCDPGNTRAPARDAGPPDAGGIPDADSDTISDADEGARDARDTDGDGTPDYLDGDSDADGIPDVIEAGDADPRTSPRDSDRDTVPDYIDSDSDGNAIPDRDETAGDLDGDGQDDYVDDDDDNDTLTDSQELRGRLDPPDDADGDGAPDYQDRDSDGDWIADGHERDLDTDRDGTPDIRDLDSDGDGLPDTVEAGDFDLDTNPIDTDGDLAPDFRDPDSDNDGLSDADEAAIYRTSHTAADSDGDGVSDLIEVAAETDPLDSAESPRTRGDFVFVVPYEEAPDPSRDTLMFRTSIQFADVYFLFDISGSMSGEITALRGAVTDIMGNLTCGGSAAACTGDSGCPAGEICSPFTSTCIEDPDASSCVASVWTGTGYYETSLWNQLSLQSDPAATRAAIRTSTTGGTERLYAAVEALASGTSPGFTTSGCTGPSAGRIGCPSYREEAVRILVVFTDEDSDGGTLAGASSALSAGGITMIGVNSGSSVSRAPLVALANASGSLDRAGAPLVFDGADAAVVPVVTTAINEIVEGVPLRVTIAAEDEPDDAGDALQFIEALETNTTGIGCTVVGTEDSDGDGIYETFPEVTPGTPVCWDVVPRMNATVEPAPTPLVFRARLTVSGDGSPLDSRLVYFLVPPRIELPGPPE